VKSVIWAVSLGSGTSGGVLAPLLMMGGALGGIEAMFLPHEGAGFWPLVSMAAMLGGTMRAPLTAVVFALELTHDVNLLLPLLLAVMVAHSFTVLILKRSILTEKVARRGYHLSCEYAVDPLEILTVGEVMRTNIVAVPEGARVRSDHLMRKGQHLYPVVDAERRVVNVVTSGDLERFALGVADLPQREPVVAYPDEPLRVVVNRMSDSGLTRFPVVNNACERKLAGMVALSDLLRARTRNLEEERHRERVLRVHLPIGKVTVR
ncbi:MAG TPA: chloride channel protein, partial [Bryobacteraceae bacterium]|nr:chloride channel protein [Bryobacteraceae bacterium]